MPEALVTTQAAELLPPDKVKEWEERIAKAEKVCPQIAVTDAQSQRLAVTALGRLTEVQKEIESSRKEALRPVNQLRSKINGVAGGLAERLKTLGDHLKRQLGDYETRQERLARERADKERKKLEQQAAADRRAAAEKRRRSEKLRSDPSKRLQADAIDSQANALEANAEATEATRVVEVAQPTTVRAAGAAVTSRKIWDVRITDLMALVQAVAKGEAPDNLLIPNIVVLRGMKPTQKNPDVPDIPGVEFYQKPSVSVRS